MRSSGSRRRQQFDNGSVYDGEWSDDVKHGQGTLTRPDGCKYEGQFVNNKAQGHGTFKHADGNTYTGQWLNDQAHGEGTYEHSDGSSYVGQWRQDVKHGTGVETWAGGGKFAGQYRDGKKHGRGKFSAEDGSTYEGGFEDDNMHGQGVYQFSDQRRFRGQWANGHMHGVGTTTWADGRSYWGEYVNDKKQGYGVFKWPDGRAYEGFWSDGKQHREGTYLASSGEPRAGKWENGTRMEWIDEGGPMKAEVVARIAEARARVEAEEARAAEEEKEKEKKEKEEKEKERIDEARKAAQKEKEKKAAEDEEEARRLAEKARAAEEEARLAQERRQANDTERARLAEKNAREAEEPVRTKPEEVPSRSPPAGSAAAAARVLKASAAEDARRLLEQDIDRLWEDAKLSESSKALAAEWCDENGVVTLMEILENTEEFVEALQLKKMEQKRLQKQLLKLGEEMQEEDEESEHEEADGVKYSVIQLVFGHPAEVARGTEALLGITTQDRIHREENGLEAIREEVKTAGTQQDSDNLQYILHGVAQEESSLPPHVVEDYKNGRYHGGKIEPGDYDHGHAGMTFKSFMEEEEAKLAGLSEPELCSIRLYTTNSFPLYNRPLRQGTKPHPMAMTVYFLINGIKKLRAVAASKPGFQEEKRLYRGMKNADLDLVKFKAEGGAEFAAMSTTPSKDVALSYSQSKKPLLFMFLAKGMSKGVDISWCSVYPKENEVLYPPGTFLRYVKDKKDPDGTKVIQIEPQMT